jgi:hypothetical protein
MKISTRQTTLYPEADGLSMSDGTAARKGRASTSSVFSSFRRKPGARKAGLKSHVWIPACAGLAKMTIFMPFSA